jgi:hypothetical protein
MPRKRRRAAQDVRRAQSNSGVHPGQESSRGSSGLSTAESVERTRSESGSSSRNPGPFAGPRGLASASAYAVTTGGSARRHPTRGSRHMNGESLRMHGAASVKVASDAQPETDGGCTGVTGLADAIPSSVAIPKRPVLPAAGQVVTRVKMPPPRCCSRTRVLPLPQRRTGTANARGFRASRRRHPMAQHQSIQASAAVRSHERGDRLREANLPHLAP